MLVIQTRLQIERPHAGQQRILNGAARFNVVVCGRRFGKTRLALIRSLKPILTGQPIAYFAPTYKMLTEFWREATNLYQLVIPKNGINKAEHRFEVVGGGSFQMWSLDSAETVRGRKYALALIDEAAMVSDLENAWNAVIRPTLTDYKGGADFFSTPKGLNYFYTLFGRGQDQTQTDWAAFQMPTVTNPFIDPAEVEAARTELPSAIFEQEYLAQFIQNEGAVFRISDANFTDTPTTPEAHTGHRVGVGIDWGQKHDFTAISIGCATCKRELALERFNRIEWALQRQRVVTLLNRWHVTLGEVELNSIGSPNFEALIQSGLRYLRGFETTASSKPPLIQSLALTLEQREFTFLNDPVGRHELVAYEARISANTGRVSYSAPEGGHDDTVIARALMRKALLGRKPGASLGQSVMR